MLRKAVTILRSKQVTSLVKDFHSSSIFREKWDLFTAVCLERKPVVNPALNELEKEFKEYLATVEFERSLKSDAELRHEREKKQLELLKKGDTDVDVIKQTMQDLIDIYTEELTKFKPAERITEADQKNDTKSLNQKLDKHLVLLVKQKLGNKEFFLLPQDRRQDGETLRQAADRVLKQTCGQELQAQIYGNAPSGFYKYKYPKAVRNESVGAKVFIYFARYHKGSLPQKGLDYKWLDRTELEKILPEVYNKSLQQMLMED